MKPVFPLDFPLNIALVAASALIAICYAIFLIKLKPSIETEPTASKTVERQKATLAELRSTRRSIAHDEAREITQEKPTSTWKNRSTKPEKSLAKLEKPAEIKKIHSEVPVRTAEVVETKEKQKTKNDEAKKAFFLFGERNFEGCRHKFGYLNDLPKNTPIPDECFGCPEIVECLKNLRLKQAK